MPLFPLDMTPLVGSTWNDPVATGYDCSGGPDNEPTCRHYMCLDASYGIPRQKLNDQDKYFIDMSWHCKKNASFTIYKHPLQTTSTHCNHSDCVVMATSCLHRTACALSMQFVSSTSVLRLTRAVDSVL